MCVKRYAKRGVKSLGNIFSIGLPLLQTYFWMPPLSAERETKAKYNTFCHRAISLQELLPDNFSKYNNRYIKSYFELRKQEKSMFQMRM